MRCWLTTVVGMLVRPCRRRQLDKLGCYSKSFGKPSEDGGVSCFFLLHPLLHIQGICIITVEKLNSSGGCLFLLCSKPVREKIAQPIPHNKLFVLIPDVVENYFDLNLPFCAIP